MLLSKTVVRNVRFVRRVDSSPTHHLFILLENNTLHGIDVEWRVFFDLFCNIFFRKFLQYWNPEPPKNPSLLPQNRFKCLRRTFIPPRQKLALYGALKRAVKILWILLPSKCCYKYINNQSFSLASTDLERVGLTILQILQILQAETRQGVSWLYNYIISIITLIQL